jgi:hypothetical protein
MEIAWEDLRLYLNLLSESQLTILTDAAGWTIKDHIMHLAVWEEGILALLNGGSRHQAMGLDDALWNGDDVDAINAAIQQQHQHRPQIEVVQALADSHKRMVAKIESMPDEDLQLPYYHYDPDSDHDEAIIHRIAGNTFEHYAEHLPWMSEIANGEGEEE